MKPQCTIMRDAGHGRAHLGLSAHLQAQLVHVLAMRAQSSLTDAASSGCMEGAAASGCGSPAFVCVPQAAASLASCMLSGKCVLMRLVWRHRHLCHACNI